MPSYFSGRTIPVCRDGEHVPKHGTEYVRKDILVRGFQCEKCGCWTTVPLPGHDEVMKRRAAESEARRKAMDAKRVAGVVEVFF